MKTLFKILMVCMFLPTTIFAQKKDYIELTNIDRSIQKQPKAPSLLEMRAIPENPEDFPEYIEFLVNVADPRTDEERKADDKLKKEFKDAFVADMLFVGAPGFPAGLTPEVYEEATQHSIDNQYNLISATISNGAPEDTPEVVKKRMKECNEYFKEHSARYVHITSIDDINRAKEEGKLGVVHNFQSMRPLGEDISNVEEYYNLGLRQMNFTYNIDAPYAAGAGSNSDGSDYGLTELGKMAIQEMNRLGIVVDLSHSSNQTAIDAAQYSRKPVVMSHSSPSVLHPVDRNSSDEAIKAVAATGGVVCVTFIGGFLNENGLAQPKDIAMHVQYIRNLVGWQATGVGVDYVYNLAETLDWILKNPENFPREMGYGTPSHLGKPGEIWGVVKELRETYGWTDEELRGFLGENILRVYKQVWEE